MLDHRILTAGMVIVTLLLGACSSEPASFSAVDPNKRLRALHTAAATNDQQAIKPMIEMLESDDAAQRFLAIEALKDQTGQTFGYEHDDPKPRRREAIKRWKAWYETRNNPTGAEQPSDGQQS